ncbi:hypothetical protein PW683_31060 [Streptomyces niveus]
MSDAWAGSGVADGSAPDGRATSPLKNPDGTAPGLAPLTSDADLAAARELIDGLAVKGRGPKSKRERFANDALNLIPVEGRANSAKGDSGPASWLPPSREIRCAYAVRFAQAALSYDMPVTAPDKQMMLRQCGAT